MSLKILLFSYIILISNWMNDEIDLPDKICTEFYFSA